MDTVFSAAMPTGTGHEPGTDNSGISSSTQEFWVTAGRRKVWSEIFEGHADGSGGHKARPMEQYILARMDKRGVS